MSNSNNSYGPWKPAMPMDIIASGNYSKRNDNVKREEHLLAEATYCPTTAPSSTAAVFAAAAAAAAANMHFAMPGMMHAGELMPGVLPLLPQSMGHPSVPSSAAMDAGQRPPIDIYTSIGMQQLGQLYKANAVANNNNNNMVKGVTGGESTDQTRRNVQHLVESAISNEGKQQIMQILEKVALLQPPERLLLYMRLPSSTSETDPLRQPQNPLGTRSEINHTINWVRSHLEQDPSVSIPKQDVYDDYVAYCTREDIKPLSTADFGKVMKQIFPGIRPRRLGTRGHSRYCYAAMRKATKLESPFLPNLNDTSGQPMSTVTYKEDTGADTDQFASWKIVKMWAESILNAEFDGVKQMADYLSKNFVNLNASMAAAAKNSRALLQKKMMQRKAKGKKKTIQQANPESAQKKRRKKRLKAQPIESPSNSNAPDDDDDDNPADDGADANLNIPAIANAHQQLSPQQQQQHHCTVISSMSACGQPQQMPINLKTNENNNKIKCEQSDIYHGMNVTGYEDMDVANVTCKVETLDGSDIEHVYCKKVRRAQEAKGLLNQAMSPMSPYVATTPDQSPAQQPQLPQKEKSTSDDAAVRPASTTSIVQTSAFSGLLPPPAIMVNDHAPSAANAAGGPAAAAIELSTPTSLAAPMQAASNKRGTNSLLMRSKKFRFLKNVASLSALNETKVDDVTTDIIIPRERVISICSLDKDALDGYLNEGDNDTPDTELLQYFQHPSTTMASENSSKCPAVTATVAVSSAITSAAQAATTAVAITQPTLSLLENYQLFGNSQAIPQQRQMSKKQEQINELRQYLQQNLQHQQLQQQQAGGLQLPCPGALMQQHLAPPPSQEMPSALSMHGPVAPRGAWQDAANNNMAHSASASLAMLSHGYRNMLEPNVNKRAQFAGAGPRRKIVGPLPDAPQVSKQPHPPQSMPGHQQQLAPHHNPPLMRSVSSSAAPTTQQSPNSRRKNFSFVPISPGPQSPRVFTQPQLHQLAQHPMHSPSQPIVSAAAASSPFVSPRATPGLRRQIPKDLATSIASSLQTSDPMIGSYKTAFSKPNQFKNEVSASAPTSPASMVHQHQHFQFNNLPYNNTAKMPSMAMGHAPQQQQLQQQQQQQQQPPPPPPQQQQLHHQQPPNLAMCQSMMENRSQSVPLHCQSPAFNSNNLTAYSSACNSIAQTPVPSEFADFCDENHLINMLADTDQNIKMEANDIPELLDAEINAASNSLHTHMLSDAMNMRGGGQQSAHHLMSRSVPSTPLPLLQYINHNSNNNNNNNSHSSGPAGGNGACGRGNSHHLTLVTSHKSFDISKSVPTTPIGHASGTPFRYSPEQNRDFLINGNSVELKTNSYMLHPPTETQHTMNNNTNNNHNNNLQTQSGNIGLTTNELEDLSNYGDVNDPIIDGSDLLDSL